MSAAAQSIYFPYNPNKANQAILWLLESQGGRIDKLKLVKELYLADKEHLLRYGRPIIGGQYYAMQHGPVSSELLKHIDQATIPSGPFILENNFIKSNTLEFSTEDLSESDIEILKSIDQRYDHFTGWSLRNLTHRLLEWKHNWGRRKDGVKRHPISYEDMFKGEKDKSMLKIILENQEVGSIF